MGFLGRLKSFVGGQPILSQDFDDEFNQIENLLDGTSTNIEVVLNNSDITLPTLELNTLGTSGMLVVFQGANNTQLVRDVDSVFSQASIVPFIISNNVLCVNLNADKLNGLDSSGYEVGLSSFLTWQVFYSDLLAGSNPKKGYWLCPDNQTVTITKLKAQQRKTASVNAQTVIEFRKNDVSIGTITIDGNDKTVKTNDIVDVTLVENDRLSININSHTGTTKHEDITASFHMKKLFNNLN